MMVRLTYAIGPTEHRFGGYAESAKLIERISCAVHVLTDGGRLGISCFVVPGDDKYASVSAEGSATSAAKTRE